MVISTMYGAMVSVCAPVAYLVGRFIALRTGKVALIAGSRSYSAHEEREAGFLHVIEEMFPPLQVVGLRAGHDDAQKNYVQMRTLLEQYPTWRASTTSVAHPTAWRARSRKWAVSTRWCS